MLVYLRFRVVFVMYVECLCFLDVGTLLFVVIVVDVVILVFGVGCGERAVYVFCLLGADCEFRLVSTGWLLFAINRLDGCCFSMLRFVGG